jgi:hypothetical protein
MRLSRVVYSCLFFFLVCCWFWLCCLRALCVSNTDTYYIHIITQRPKAFNATIHPSQAGRLQKHHSVKERGNKRKQVAQLLYISISGHGQARPEVIDAVSTPFVTNHTMCTTGTFDVRCATLNTVITKKGRATHNRPIKEHGPLASQPT